MRKQTVASILWDALRRHGIRSLLTLLVILGSIVLEVIPPLVLARAIDQLTNSRAIALSLAAAYFLVLALSGVADALREALIVAVGENITHALRTQMRHKLTRLPAAYFTEHEAGKTAALQVNDVDAIEEMFTSGLVSMITDLGTVVAIIAVIFTKSRGLGILLLVVLPFLIAFTRHVQKNMLAAHTENRTATASASGILPETMHIIRSLHVYQAENYAERRYDAAIQHSFRAIEKTNFYDAIYSPVILTVSAAVIGVMMSLSGQSGAFRSWFGVSVGTAVALIAYVNKVFTPLSSIGMEIQTVQSAAAGWKRVQTFLDEPERTMPPGEHTNTAAEPEIDVRNVSFSYDGSHPVLRNLSLDVRKGELVTLAGRTGVGKSTLFKLLLGLYEPEKGTIRVAGIRPQEMSDTEKRRILCCVEQKLTSVPGNVRDQVTLGSTSFTDAEVWRALETADLADTVRALPDGLATPYRDSLFSQGQKQLLMIARACVSDPEILLLDEITAGLDSATEQVVLSALRRASENRTVLSISHRLAETADRGRIVRIDPA